MNKHLIHKGDLLFIRTSSEILSKTISESTRANSRNDVNPPSYTHVALVEVHENSFWVMHAIPEKGCIRQSLTSFLDERDTMIDLYRLKQAIPFYKVIQRAQNLLGAPYNHSFRQEDEGYYCSEFIFEAFRFTNIFQLSPMEFGPGYTILPDWTIYYHKLGLEVPNRKPGTSPNSLIRQNKLSFITTLKKPN